MTSILTAPLPQLIDAMGNHCQQVPYVWGHMARLAASHSTAPITVCGRRGAPLDVFCNQSFSEWLLCQSQVKRGWLSPERAIIIAEFLIKQKFHFHSTLRMLYMTGMRMYQIDHELKSGQSEDSICLVTAIILV